MIAHGFQIVVESPDQETLLVVYAGPDDDGKSHDIPARFMSSNAAQTGRLIVRPIRFCSECRRPFP